MKHRRTGSTPRRANYGIAHGPVVVARGVAHQHDAQGLLRVDSHHVPEAGPAAEVLDESRTPPLGPAGAEPAEPEVPPAPLGVTRRISATDPADSSPRAVGLTAFEVQLNEPGCLVDASDQSPVGRALDVEGSKDAYLPYRGPTTPLGNAALRSGVSGFGRGW